jgi:hypothetical protein
MKNKNAALAVTFFIIIGIVLLIVVAIVMQSKGYFAFILGSKYSDVQNYVDSCLGQTTESGLVYVGSGWRGGNSVETEFANVSIGPVEEAAFNSALEDYIEANVQKCTGNFSAFPGYTIEQGTPKATVILAPSKVVAKLDFPLTIYNGDKTAQLSTFEAEKSIRAKLLIATANSLLAKKHYDMNYLDSISMNTTIYKYEDADVIVLEDNAFGIKGQPYRLIFAINK